jgi:hypothetical protein
MDTQGPTLFLDFCDLWISSVAWQAAAHSNREKGDVRLLLRCLLDAGRWISGTLSMVFLSLLFSEMESQDAT